MVRTKDSMIAEALDEAEELCAERHVWKLEAEHFKREYLELRVQYEALHSKTQKLRACMLLAAVLFLILVVRCLLF